MKIRSAITVAFFFMALPSSASQEDEKEPAEEKKPTSVIPELDLPLPAWSDEEFQRIEKGERNTDLGGGLWPYEQIPLFLEVGLEDAPVTPAVNADTSPGKLLSYALFNQYFAERPPTFLSDPQDLTTRPFHDAVDRFLTYHSSESKIATYVLVFEKGQEFPIELSTRAIWRRWFPEGYGAIIFYYMGEPEATAIEFGQAFAEAAGSDRLEALLDTCTADALESDLLEGGQLERFCVKYSVETYKLEKTLAEEMVVLPIVAGDFDDSAEPQDRRVVWGALGVLLAAVGGGTTWWVRGRRPLYFPEIENLPLRLGGEHTGGTDAVVSFGRTG